MTTKSQTDSIDVINIYHMTYDNELTGIQH